VSGGSDRKGSGSASGFERSMIEIGDPAGDLAREQMPVEWAGTWSSLLLPFVGIALFVLYFLFLRRRRKDAQGEEEDDLESFLAESAT
jgi:LPXTG-motif cell wall-anchored protein